MSPRQLIVLVVAAIAAVGALLLIRGMGAPRAAPQSAEQAQPIAGEQVLVAAHDIAQGAALAPTDLAVAVFPTGSVSQSFIRLSQQPSAQADFVGAVAHTFGSGVIGFIHSETQQAADGPQASAEECSPTFLARGDGA